MLASSCIGSTPRYECGEVVEYCKGLLTEYPQETQQVLRYFDEVAAFDQVADTLAQFLRSNDAVFDVQNYQIMYYFANHVNELPDDYIMAARALAFGYSQFFLKSVARSIIRERGTAADLERLESMYASTSERV